MLGLMQDWPLNVSSILDFAAKYHPNRRIVSRTVEGPIVETNWAGIKTKALKCAEALRSIGTVHGDRVGVMAWNTARHLEVWYGVSGCGAILHSLNPRLFDDQLIYIINHAEDRFVMLDVTEVPLMERIADRLETVERFIILTDRAHMPETTLKGALCYEDWVAGQSTENGWTPVPELSAAGICYTSGTTGNPKGVVYSHRSHVLHAMTVMQPDLLGLSSRDVVMPVVAMFHANGWSTAFSSPAAGAGMVLPGRDMSPAALYELLEHGVTITLAVPTVWLPLLRYLEETGKNFATLKRVVIGGSACPRAVMEAFQDAYGVDVIHAWGMTETSPLGSFATLTPETDVADRETVMATKLKAGRPFYTVDLKIIDEAGAELSWDGEVSGRLMIRGPGVLRRYLKQDQDVVDDEGWFDTGDVASIDPNGFIRITDRSKDVIKSGGEWISSIDLENLAVGHPGVAEAAAIGVAHPKWDERPILVVVKAEGMDPSAEEIRAHVASGVAKWQVPDDVIFVDEIPHTATGKISKVTIREQLRAMNYALPEARGAA